MSSVTRAGAVVQVYFDNASTSYPKPEEVHRATLGALKNLGGNPGRAGHRKSLEAARAVLEARETVARLFNIEDTSRLIFTLNATTALNMALKGLLSAGDHLVTTSMEHNSLMRPIHGLEQHGVEVEVVQCDIEGRLDPGTLINALRPRTRLIAVIHASNVVGAINPIAEIGKHARARGIPLLVDAAQTAGSLPIDVEADCVDLLACSGHKGLLGPQGTGLLYIKEGIELEPLIEGGTGSSSEDLAQPSLFPDRYESGTLNTPGVVGLGAGVKYILEAGLEKIRGREVKLTTLLLEGLNAIEGVEVYGPPKAVERMPVVSFTAKGMDPASIGQRLDDEFGIMTRVGLHCSPAAHKTIGTFPEGTVRVSMGYFNTGDEVEYFLDSLDSLLKR